MEAYNNYNKGSLLRGQYRKLADLSKGSYGLVSVAEDTAHHNRLVAVKYIYPLPKKNEGVDSDSDSDDKLHPLAISPPSQSILQTLYDEAKKEINIHKILGVHENIATLYDHFDSCLVLEYCSRGDLYDAIQDGKGPSTSQDIKDVFYQILDALQYCHLKNVFHRDLKPENILIAEDWSIKLCDWGLATSTRMISNRNEFDVGSERYMAPELFDPEVTKYDAAKIDLWSIGIILLTLVFHKNPFQIANHSDKRFLQFVMNREALFDIFSTMSGEMFSVLRFCLNIDPTNRDIESLRKELDSLKYFTIDEEYWEDGLGGQEEIADEGDEDEEEEEEEDGFDYENSSSSGSRSTSSQPIEPISTSATIATNSPNINGLSIVDDGSAAVTASPRSIVPPLKALTSPLIGIDSAIEDSPADSAMDSDVTGISDAALPMPHNHRADALLSKNSSMLPIPIVDVNSGAGYNTGNYSIFRNPRKPFGVASFSQKENGSGFSVGSNKFNREDFFTPKSVFNHYMENNYQPPHQRQNYSNSNNGINNSNSNINNNINNNNNNNNSSNRNYMSSWKKKGKRRSWKKATIDSDTYEHVAMPRLRLRLRVRNSFNGAHMMNNPHSRDYYKKKAHLFLSTKPKKLFTNGNGSKMNGTHYGHHLSTQLEQLQQHPQISTGSKGKYVPPYLRSPHYLKSPLIEPPTEEIGSLNLDDEDEVFHLEDDFEEYGMASNEGSHGLGHSMHSLHTLNGGIHNTLSSFLIPTNDFKKPDRAPINFKVPTYGPSLSTTSTTAATVTSERRGRRNSLGNQQRPFLNINNATPSSVNNNSSSGSYHNSSINSIPAKPFATISEFATTKGKYVPPYRRGSHTSCTPNGNNSNIIKYKNGNSTSDEKRKSQQEFKQGIFNNLDNTSSSVPTGKTDWFSSYKKDWGDYDDDES